MVLVHLYSVVCALLIGSQTFVLGIYSCLSGNREVEAPNRCVTVVIAVAIVFVILIAGAVALDALMKWMSV